MEINITGPEKHLVHDYDITIDSGGVLQVTIDEVQGDSITFGDFTTTVKLSEKPSRINPKETLGAEEIVIFTPHILLFTHKTRMATMPDAQDESNWMNTYKSAGATIQ